MYKASTSLEAIILERVRAAGRLTFAEYMDLALYHPQLGYYTSGAPKVGLAVDFFTSARLHPLFGACLARQIIRLWNRLGCPQPFVVVEEGAAQGLLATHIEEAIKQMAPGLADVLRYYRVDIGQLALPGAIVNKAASPHVVLSNELIDAFPVHLVESYADQLREVYVVEREGRLAEELDAPSSDAVACYLDQYRIEWRAFGRERPWRAEVNLRALEWIRDTASRLARGGYVLTIDYGDTARRLYINRRRRGTLLCYFRHNTNEEPLARPGQQDITAHVNFTALIDEGRRAGLRRSRFTTQRDFLLGWGIRELGEDLRISRFAAADTARHTDQGQADLLRYLSLRNAVTALLDPDGLGGYRVLLQHKDS